MSLQVGHGTIDAPPEVLASLLGIIGKHPSAQHFDEEEDGESECVILWGTRDDKYWVEFYADGRVVIGKPYPSPIPADELDLD